MEYIVHDYTLFLVPYPWVLIYPIIFCATTFTSVSMPSLIITIKKFPRNKEKDVVESTCLIPVSIAVSGVTTKSLKIDSWYPRYYSTAMFTRWHAPSIINNNDSYSAFYNNNNNVI